MPHFYFHLRNDISVDDEEGKELPSLHEAHALAVKSAREMAANSVLEHGHICLSHRILVADESGAVLMTVEFGDVLAIEA